MVNRKFEQLASEFIENLKTLVNNSDNLDTFQGYLEMHFDLWMKNYVFDPESLTNEIKYFAHIDEEEA